MWSSTTIWTGRWMRCSGSFKRCAPHTWTAEMPLDPTPIPKELRGLRIALLVAGGIAAYKLVDLASALTQAGSQVRVAITPSAARFVGAPSFRGGTGNPGLTSLWAPGGAPAPHLFLGAWAEGADRSGAVHQQLLERQDGFCYRRRRRGARRSRGARVNGGASGTQRHRGPCGGDSGRDAR